ncbi:CLMP1 [Scenedesmus sp. PABB004]|nr:CLMP1 [Scenedesmus sp. PABB004]
MAKGKSPKATPKGLVPAVAPEVAQKVADLKNGGNKLFAQREYAKAIEQYDTALKELPGGAPERADLLCNKAAALYGLGKLKDAVKECGSALEVSPGSIKALRHRAKALERQGLFKQALTDIQAINKGDSASDDTREAERRLRDLVAGRRPSLANGGARAAGPSGAGGMRGNRSPLSWPFSAKVTLGGETRLVQLSASAGYADLVAGVAAKFPGAGPAVLKYADRDGDMVTITCRSDVQTALAEALKATDARLRLIPPIRVTATPAAQGDVPPIPLDEAREAALLQAQQQQQLAAAAAAAAAGSPPAKQTAQLTGSGEVIEVDDWLVDFANLFRDMSGIDADRHIDFHNEGWAACTRAMEATLRSDEAVPLFAKAVERFKEVTATGYVNWGNVHVCVGHKHEDVAALAGEAPGPALAAAVAAEFDKAEALFKQALGVKPDHFESLAAMASLEFDRAKLAAKLLAKPVSSLPEGVEEGSPEAEAAAKAANDAQLAATREALARLKAADVDSAAPHMDAAHTWYKQAAEAAAAAESAHKAEAAAKAGDGDADKAPAAAAASAGGAGGDMSLAGHAQVLYGNSLYEWSQVLAAVGKEWRALLDQAVDCFKAAGCAQADIRAALKNHSQAEHLDLGDEEEEPPAPAPQEPAKQQQAPPQAKGLPALERSKAKAAAPHRTTQLRGEPGPMMLGRAAPPLARGQVQHEPRRAAAAAAAGRLHRPARRGTALRATAAPKPQKAGAATAGLFVPSVQHLELLAQELLPEPGANVWQAQPAAGEHQHHQQHGHDDGPPEQQQHHEQPEQQQRAPHSPPQLLQRPAHLEPRQQEQASQPPQPAAPPALQRPALTHAEGLAAQQRASLAALLHSSREGLATLTAREPRLAAATPEELGAALAGLAGALRTTPRSVAAAARKQPALLFLPPASVPARLHAAAQALCAPVSRCSRAALQQPLLLLSEPAALQARVRAAAAALKVPPAQACGIVMARPQLLAAAPATLAAKLANLQGVLALTRSQALRLVASAPCLLEYSASGVSDKVGALGELLAATPALLRRLVLEEPCLLTRGPGQLGARLVFIGSLTGVDPGAAQAMARARPCLLTRSEAQLARSYRALSIWRLPPDYKAALLAEHPLLLRLSPREVHGRCRWLRELMLRDAVFHATFRALPPVLLGVVVLHLPVAWRRLQYLVEAGRESAVPLMEAVQLPEARFAAAFPEYAKWRCWTDGTAQAHSAAAPWRVTAPQLQKRQRRERGAARPARSSAQATARRGEAPAVGGARRAGSGGGPGRQEGGSGAAGA